MATKFAQTQTPPEELGAWLKEQSRLHQFKRKRRSGINPKKGRTQDDLVLPAATIPRGTEYCIYAYSTSPGTVVTFFMEAGQLSLVGGKLKFKPTPKRGGLDLPLVM